MKTLTVRLPEQLAALLEHESRRTHLSKSEIVRSILDRHLKAASDSALDLAGCVDSTLDDLSTNKDRLQGFGR
ncbi:MAG: ribbon-helix-helix domain-containing protein [Chloroflexota bacterium]|nr:ribbon-helix-helix domain-containing protein [Chloroflexota bacterium]